MDNNSDYSEFQLFAEKLALNAGEIILKLRGKAIITKSKSDALDIVTEADEKSEKYILKQIINIYPDHNILTEESGEINNNVSEYCWIIDPVDGTKEFARGLPLFSVNIGLEKNGKCVIGVIYCPTTHELFSARFGGGAFLNGNKIHVSNQKELDKSLFMSHAPRRNTDVKKYDAKWKTLLKIAQKVYRFRMMSNDEFSLSWVALGGYEGMYSPLYCPKWDITPALLLVTEAGGRVTTGTGNPFTFDRFKDEGLLATNGLIHDDLLRIINS